jgi:S1-C subfamily serine protease
MTKKSSTPVIVAAAAVIGLGLGATVLRGAVPTSGAQTQQQTQATPNAIDATFKPGDTTQPLGAQGSKLQNEANTIAIVKQYEPGLVYVTTQAPASTDPFGQTGAQGSGQGQSGVGSGFFVDAAGDILTNFHVVTEGGQALGATITVRVQGQKTPVKAKIIGLAPQYDLALIRPENIDKALIKPIPLGDSSQLQVGQKTVAMGAPFGFDFSVTEGIISSTARQIPIGFNLSAGSAEGITQNAIQTDAAINPGNSGGPLLDSTGRIIGINTQIISPAGAQSGVGQSAGIGFAIPINTAKNLLERLKTANGGFVLAPTIGVEPGLVAIQDTGNGAARIDVGVDQLTEQARARYNLPESGFLIGKVTPSSPAAKAGLRGGNSAQTFNGGQITPGGDVVISADGNPVNSRQDLQAAYISKKAGDTVKLEVVNAGQKRNVTVTLDQTSFTTTPIR